MTRRFVTPPGAIRYILLQRPMLQRYNRLAKRLHLPFPAKLSLESFLFRRKVERWYWDMIQREYETIRSRLPVEMDTMLDIGCGVAGIDILVFRHYGEGLNMRFCLSDKTDDRSMLHYGFPRQDEFYNSLEISRRMLCANGVHPGSIILIEASPTHEIPVRNLDLVISIASWGFHYPVSTYLEQVHQALKPKGCVIVDLRKSHGEEDALKTRFERLELLSEVWDGKANRYWAVRQP